MVKLIFYTVVFSCIGYAQQLVVKTNNDVQSVPATSNVIASIQQGKIVVADYKPEAKARFIIELTSTASLGQKQYTALSAQSPTVQRAEVKQKILLAAPEMKINREFSKALNGFAVTAWRKDINSIRNMAGVKSVYADVIVNTFPFTLSVATPIVHSSSTTAATGRGIKIGIIDTGIDYMHEALGGGYGPSFKVAGGYDFVNNDNDPSDDNGHGTHVAGIVAGKSSTLNSLAHDAQLYSYKVLDQQGSGHASDVIAAIERAMSDSIDIINLSLGSAEGNSDDGLCSAVNRAVEAGIVVVVAAGNAGDFGTVHSPGIAKLALTVGATDAAGIASFSAKGPVSAVYEIKPDVVAPGVGILSAKLGGGYVQMSGTSMSAPYVTSLAAALKELHPAWTSLQLKDAIQSHAIAMNTSLFAQGNGKVDEEKTVSADAVISPAHLTFGFDPPDVNSWSKEDTIEIYNASNKTKTYTLTSSSTNPALVLKFTPKNFDMAPLETKKVIVQLSTNNLFLGNNKAFAEGYTGKIFAFSNTDTLNIPFTFFKGNILQMTFSETPWQVVVHNQKNFSTSFVPKSNNVSLVVGKGTYDLITSFYNSYFVVKESVAVSGCSQLMINKNEAVYDLSMAPSDEHGKRIDLLNPQGIYYFIEDILYKPAGFAFVGMGGGMMTTAVDTVQHFSLMSTNYSIGYSLHLQFENTTSYTYDFGLDSGMTESKNIAFTVNDVRRVETQFDVDAKTQRIFPLTWTSFTRGGNVLSVTFYNGNAAPLTSPFRQTSFYANRTSTSSLFHFKEAYTY
ncbi:MAG: S8 family serine peptidase [Bacteroidota bacterium]|nr:S8 family serine peptidase [Bacteroidota bacterium]